MNILQTLKSTIKYTFPELFYARMSFSQEGEYLLIARFLDESKKGFYVDIGAHHPFRYSNTYYFYKKGWKGINIDALPGSMELFNKVRPRDINLEIGISEKASTLTYYQFDEPAINGFSKELSLNRKEHTSYKIIAETPVKTFPLATILEQHLPQNTPITFLSVDVEGLDLAVLQSNDWSRFLPLYILVEALEDATLSATPDPLTRFLTSKGYRFVAKTKNTCLFELQQQIA